MSGTEDYLDGLLNSISEKDLDTKKKTGSETMQTEEDIMNDMENDLLSKEAEDNFLEQFEKELQNEKSSPEEEKTDDFFNSLDQIVDGADHNNNDDDFLMDTLGDIPGIDDVTKTEGLSQAQTMEKEPDEQSEDTAEPAQASDDAGSDTFGMDDAGSTGLDDFGDLGGADMFGDSEAEETEITPDGIEETPKKEGFLKKLSRILFGEDDEDEKGDSVSSQKEPLTGENAGDIDLSDPNMQILQELGDIPDISDAPKEEEKPDPKEEKKKKKEKKKKEKQEEKRRQKKLSVQQSIAYKEMGRDGICRVQGKTYSKCIRFYDINYQLAQNEDKNAIFENWCDFLNYFDASIHFQLSFINHKSSMKEFEQVIRIRPQDDDFDDVRMEYAKMLKQQLAKGNNGLVKSKYITFSIEADNIREAKPKLERIESDILNNFKILGVPAYPLNGVERLQILYETFNPDVMTDFQFDYGSMIRTGLNTKDYVAPTSFVFRDRNTFQMGNTIGAVSYLQILAPELTDKMLAEFLDIDKNLIVNLHVQSVDQMKAIKLVKSKVTDINRMKIEEQKKAVRAGYDMDIIPSDLNTYGGEAKRLLEDLQSRNERMFLVTALFLNTAKTKQALDNAIFQTAGIAQKYNCVLKRLDYQQEEGLMSSVPLGVNHIPIKRALTTTSTAIFVPFTTQELFMAGESLYYGLNALSNNMIMVDRKKLKNPNGLILGTPGSGKSFAAKREITNAFFVTKDDIIIGDPEGEYYPLVHALGGQVVHISPTSKDYINPMDINMDYSDDDNPLGVKSDFVLSLCELIMGSRDGIEAEEKSVIDRCLPLVYQKYFADPKPENMPVLGDLYDCLRKQKEPQAQRIATALEIYVNGSLKVFNHRTNVELNNRIVCFDIKELGKQLKKIGMLIVQDQVWNRVTINRGIKSTRYYIDEFHLLLKEEQTAAYSVEIWKRFRKWGGVPTGITQNIKDLLASREIENIFENSDFILMLNQAAGDRQILAKQLNISPYQLSYVTNSGEGEGLLFYGTTIIPFKDKFDKTLKLYGLMTTKPEETLKRDKEMRDANEGN